MVNCKIIKLKDIANIEMGQSPKGNTYNSDSNGMPFLQGNKTFGRLYPIIDTWTTDPKKIGKRNSILMSVRAPVGEINIANQDICIGRGLCSISMKNGNTKYLYYVLKNSISQIKSKTTGTVFDSINKKELENIEIIDFDETTQNRIIKILSQVDDKIELNNKINDNLSEQLKQIFNNKFFDKIQNNDSNEFKEYNLYDVLDVIDNRGKTPKLVEYSKYPIIDVRAISGENRIIDYKQCQKYVDEEVYNTFFRSGHPKINDILISTVGSLAEMKIYKENKGTIAQNVVALRCKEDYPMYIYQYLKAIKNDLISYNIGSVQPSIKVTQFMKHSIFIPKENELYEFENMAQIYTDKMFNISKENETLEQLRDTLLPKLMNGEIDLDKIEI